jgi:replication factor C small subunit|tara:strand:- start:8085 stop:9005 length:921 start_codon:yes stop_codon:yes gene_type:complete
MIKEHTLFTERFRPTDPKDYIGNEVFKSSLDQWIKQQDIPHILLYGPAGTGKTTAAKLITTNLDCDSIYINCSDENGIETIREKVKSFASAATFRALKVVIMDEADFLTINAQAALRNVIESFSKTTRFVFTCNYIERIIDPIQSRTSVFEILPPSKSEVAKRCKEILHKEACNHSTETLVDIVNKTYPDIRKTLNLLQSCIVYDPVGTFLQLNKDIVNQKQYTDQIIDLIKSHDDDAFTKIRQIVADSNIRDYNELYRALFENLDSFHNPVLGTIIISESQYQSVLAPDKEITFMACIANLIKPF